MENLAALRGEVGALAFGGVLIALGLGSAVFALARRRTPDARLLLDFGPFALLYGLRLAARTDLVQEAFPAPLAWAYVRVACTYLLPVVLLTFFEELHGPGWRGSLRACRWLWTVYAGAALAIDALRGPGTAMGPNSVLVVVAIVVAFANLLRAGRLVGRGLILVRVSGLVLGLLAVLSNLADLQLFPWKPPEEVGFAIFIASLCVLAAERYGEGERRLLAIGAELETAQRIQTSLLPRTLPEMATGPDAPFALAARSRPATAVGGDLYDWSERAEESGPRRLELLVADVAGHGVPAALLAAMVKMALSVETSARRAPEEVLSALNATLHGKFERSFVTVAFLELAWDGTAATLRFASGGHPAPLLLPAGGAVARELAAEGPVLGRFRSARFLGGTTPLAPGDRVLVYSDGLVEAPGPAGEPFGEARLHAALLAHRSASAADFVDRLLADIGTWSAGAPKEAAEREDDVTLVVLDRSVTRSSGALSPSS